MRRFGIPVAILAAAAFGCSGGGVQYFQVASQQATLVTQNATNCARSNGPTDTLSGIDGIGTWAIYTAPPVGGQTQYLLDTGSPDLLEGQLSGGSYTFNGVYTNEQKPVQSGGPDVINTTKMTIIVTPSGDGFTGSVSVEKSCSETGGSHECQGAQAAASFDCTSQYAVTGTQITGAQDISAAQAAAVQQPQGAGGPGGGGGGSGGSGGSGSSSGNGSSGGGGGSAFQTKTYSGTITISVNGSSSGAQQDSESVVATGGLVDFPQFLSHVLQSCDLTFSASGNSASLSGAPTCLDSQGNSWSFQSGSLRASGGLQLQLQGSFQSTQGGGGSFTLTGNYQ